MCEEDRELDGDMDDDVVTSSFMYIRVHFATEQIIMGIRFDVGWYDIRRSAAQDDGEVGF